MRSETKYTSVTVLLLLSIMLTLLRIENALLVGYVLLAMCFCIVRPIPVKQWNTVDKVFVIAVGYCVVSGFYSICSFQAYFKALVSVQLLLTYMLIRRLFSSSRQSALFNKLFALITVFVLLFAIISFFYFRHNVFNVGFNETYHFRHLFHPLGYLNNVWAEISLLMIGYSCLVRRYSMVLLPLGTVSVMLSFSRGAYLAYAVYIILYITFVNVKRERGRVMVLSAVAIIIVACFCYDEMLTTISLNADMSQQRSVSFRENRTENDIKIASAKPLFGYGIGSYTLVTDASCDKSFTNIAPNISSLLAVEGGLVAVALLLAFCTAVLREVWKHKEKNKARIVGCILVALMLKEMAQGTLLETHSACMLALICLALPFRKKAEPQTSKKSLKPNLICLIASLVCCLLIAFPQYKNEAQSIKNMCKAVEYPVRNAYDDFQIVVNKNIYDMNLNFLSIMYLINKEEYAEAEKVAHEQLSYSPDNVFYKFLLGKILYINGDMASAKGYMVSSMLDCPRLFTLKDMETFDKSFSNDVKKALLDKIHKKTYNPVTSAKYGYLLYYMGYKAKSKTYLTFAVDRLPNLSTPWLLLGDKGKYKLLTDGAFSMCRKEDKNEDTRITLMELFSHLYNDRFKTWYGQNLILKPDCK